MSEVFTTAVLVAVGASVYLLRYICARLLIGGPCDREPLLSCEAVSRPAVCRTATDSRRCRSL